MDGEGLVVPVVFGANDVDIRINPSLGGAARATNGFANLLRQGFRERGQWVQAADRRRTRLLALALLLLQWARERGGGRGDEAEEGEGGWRLMMREGAGQGEGRC